VAKVLTTRKPSRTHRDTIPGADETEYSDFAETQIVPAGANAMLRFRLPLGEIMGAVAPIFSLTAGPVWQARAGALLSSQRFYNSPLLEVG
jgi:hypothetical protein